MNSLSSNEFCVHTCVHTCVHVCKSCLSTDMNELKDSSVVKSMHCSHTEPEFSSQHPPHVPHNCLEHQHKEELTPRPLQSAHPQHT